MYSYTCLQFFDQPFPDSNDYFVSFSTAFFVKAKFLRGWFVLRQNAFRKSGLFGTEEQKKLFSRKARLEYKYTVLKYSNIVLALKKKKAKSNQMKSLECNTIDLKFNSDVDLEGAVCAASVTTLVSVINVEI